MHLPNAKTLINLIQSLRIELESPRQNANFWNDVISVAFRHSLATLEACKPRSRYQTKCVKLARFAGSHAFICTDIQD